MSKLTLGVENGFHSVVFKYVPFQLHIYVWIWHGTGKMSAAWRIECLSALPYFVIPSLESVFSASSDVQSLLP